MNIVATQLQCSAGGGRVHKCTSYYSRVELLQNIVLLTIALFGQKREVPLCRGWCELWCCCCTLQLPSDTLGPKLTPEPALTLLTSGGGSFFPQTRTFFCEMHLAKIMTTCSPAAAKIITLQLSCELHFQLR